jgi:hypothetical protein
VRTHTVSNVMSKNMKQEKNTNDENDEKEKEWEGE